MKTGPPIIVVFFDQLRADALGAAGHPIVQTPHLDRVAAEAVRFETCITNAPLCRPARYTLMTGLPVARHGVASNLRAPAPDGLPSHVRRLRDEAGYHPIVVGKTHLHNGGGHLDEHRPVLRKWGFDDAVELPDAQQTRVRSAHADWLSATTAKGDIDKYDRWRDYVAHYDVDRRPPDEPPWRLSIDDHLDTFCARVAAEKICAYQDDRPLYLAVNFPGPHPPFDPPRAFIEALDPGDPAWPHPIVAASTGPVSPAAVRYRRRRTVTPDTARTLQVRYFGKVALIDRSFGYVWQALDEARLLDEAWVILSADHGELLGDHGLTGKVLPYEAAIRVPLIIRPPGGCAPFVDRGPVDLLDVVATMLDWAALEPGERRPLTDRVLGRATTEPPQSRAIIFENMGYVGIRGPDATLAWDRASARPVELYDRRLDPDQLRNVVDDPAFAPLRAELTDALFARARHFAGDP